MALEYDLKEAQAWRDLFKKVKEQDEYVHHLRDRYFQNMQRRIKKEGVGVLPPQDQDEELRGEIQELQARRTRLAAYEKNCQIKLNLVDPGQIWTDQQNRKGRFLKITRFDEKLQAIHHTVVSQDRWGNWRDETGLDGRIHAEHFLAFWRFHEGGDIRVPCPTCDSVFIIADGYYLCHSCR